MNTRNDAPQGGLLIRKVAAGRIRRRDLIMQELADADHLISKGYVAANTQGFLIVTEAGEAWQRQQIQQRLGKVQVQGNKT